MPNPRFSIRTLLIGTAFVAIALCLQMRLHQRAHQFEATFSEVSNEIHKFEGNGRLWEITEVTTTDRSTLLDRLLFRCRLNVKYKASMIDGPNTVTVYDCDSEFLIKQAGTVREKHTATWYTSWT